MIGLGEIALPEGANLPFTEGVMELFTELLKKYYNPKTMYCKISKP